MAVMNTAVSLIILVFISLRHCRSFNLDTSEIQNDETKNEDSSKVHDPAWYRLPEFVLPENYELWIFPQLAINDFTYEGRVEIHLRVLLQTNSLIVHADGLDIDPDESRVVGVINGTRTDTPIVKQELDIERQMYVVSFAKNIPPGRYVLSLSFVGEILDDWNGFYRSSYEKAGTKRWLGITQFSPIFARRAFPCLDEPYMKAKYRTHIGHYLNETVTGNTMVENVQQIKPGYALTTLAETPPMSTYLVGWAIHDFSYTKAPDNSTEFTLWSRESTKNHDERVLNECAKIYDALDKWIQVKNPIGKMEQIAVPDFYWSAMENWGMITFRESAILWEDGVTPASKIHSGLITIAHEYSHTWFGNLVTPKFWNVAWLKEGFATFFSYYAIDIVHRDWRMMDMFGVEVLQSGLLQDSFRHDRTMNGKGVGRPQSIPRCMDFVTYKKGSSIIRMVYYLIGDRAFHHGLKSYIKALANKHAVPADFYQHLQHFADQETILKRDVHLGDVVESWANQPGYPVVTVTRNYTTTMAEVTQEKFHLDRDEQSDVPDDSRWWIPVSFVEVETGARNVSTESTVWMTPKDKRVLVSTIRPNYTIICNVRQTYYYRVNYDEENWRRLIAHLKSADFKNIAAVDRATLLDDSFNLAKAGYIDFSIPLSMSTYLIQENDYEPWAAAAVSFDFLNIMLSSSPDLKKAFQAHVNRAIQPIFHKLTIHGKPSDGMRTRRLRNIIMWTACSMNNVQCSESANSLFKEWLANRNTKIDPDSKSSVYCAGIRSGSVEDWHKVLEIFLQTELHTEQELLITGLGCTDDSLLVNEFLNYSLYDGPEIRKQYRLAIFEAVLAGSPANVENVLNFIDKNLKLITSVRDASFLANIFDGIKKRIVRDEQLRKLTILVDRNTELLGSTVEAARKAIQFAKDNVFWVASYAPKISKWLI